MPSLIEMHEPHISGHQPAENPINGSPSIRKWIGWLFTLCTCLSHSVAEMVVSQARPTAARRDHEEEGEEKGKGDTQRQASGNAGFQDKPCTIGETMGARTVSVFRAYRS